MGLFSRKDPEEKRLEKFQKAEAKTLKNINKMPKEIMKLYFLCKTLDEFEKVESYFKISFANYFSKNQWLLNIRTLRDSIAGLIALLVCRNYEDGYKYSSFLFNNFRKMTPQLNERGDYSFAIATFIYINGICAYKLGHYPETIRIFKRNFYNKPDLSYFERKNEWYVKNIAEPELFKTPREYIEMAQNQMKLHKRLDNNPSSFEKRELYEIATTNESREIREMATTYITDPILLKNICRDEEDIGIREIACMNMTKVDDWADVVTNTDSLELANFLLETMPIKKRFFDIVNNAKSPQIAIETIKHIEDEEILKKIVETSDNALYVAEAKAILEKSQQEKLEEMNALERSQKIEKLAEAIIAYNGADITEKDEKDKFLLEAQERIQGLNLIGLDIADREDSRNAILELDEKQTSLLAEFQHYTDCNKLIKDNWRYGEGMNENEKISGLLAPYDEIPPFAKDMLKRKAKLILEIAECGNLKIVEKN